LTCLTTIGPRQKRNDSASTSRCSSATSCAWSEVKNLADRDFFNRKSVLAGSMALRCFGSPRFTVYDADLSTSSDTVDPPEAIERITRSVGRAV
jgi:hypothetical protein